MMLLTPLRALLYNFVNTPPTSDCNAIPPTSQSDCTARFFCMQVPTGKRAKPQQKHALLRKRARSPHDEEDEHRYAKHRWDSVPYVLHGLCFVCPLRCSNLCPICGCRREGGCCAPVATSQDHVRVMLDFLGLCKPNLVCTGPLCHLTHVHWPTVASAP